MLMFFSDNNKFFILLLLGVRKKFFKFTCMKIQESLNGHFEYEVSLSLRKTRMGT